MTQTIDFVFDFGSPNVYLANRVLPSIAEKTGAKINVIPCLLGGIFKSTGNQPPMAAFGAVKGKLDYEMLEMRRFIEKHGLDEFTMNPNFPINTLVQMRGLIAAQMDDDGDRYIRAIMKAMWEDGKNLNDPAVTAEVWSDAGFDADALFEQTKQEAIKTKLIGNTNDAVARGAFGAPTFFVGNDMFFGKDRLTQVEEAVSQ